MASVIAREVASHAPAARVQLMVNRFGVPALVRHHHSKGEAMPTPTGHTSAIRASKVIGTSVYNHAGDKIGKVEDVVLDKQSNNIMFAVVGFGGFLGMNEKFHPLPWSTLDYQKNRDGYVVNMTKEQLQAAPADGIDELTARDGDGLRDSIYDYYKAPRYWQ
jgi:sporulation protein YlmC with PRC-barrel domain